MAKQVRAPKSQASGSIPKVGKKFPGNLRNSKRGAGTTIAKRSR